MSKARSSGRTSVAPILFVSLVWVIALVGAVCFIYGYASRYVPWSDDWDAIVPYYSGEQPITIDWLWDQHNEHRVLVPRLILLALLKTTGGDLRVVMFFNVALLAALAAWMVFVAGRLRGRPSYADAFFPLALLNLAQYENLLNAWQVQMVASAFLAGVLLCLIAQRPLPWRIGLATTASTCLFLLPLCGANGLVLTIPLAVWMGYAAIRQRRAGVPHSIGAVWALLLGAAAAFALTGVYFIGLNRSPWSPQDPSLEQGLRAAVQTLGLVVGIAPALALWPWLAGSLLALVMATAAALALQWWWKQGDRTRVLGLLLLLCASTALAFGIGWKRVGHGPPFPIISRYVTLVVPITCVIYLSWVLRGGHGGRWVQWGLFLLMWGTVWINVSDSRERAWLEIRQTTLAFEQRLQSRSPIPVLAAHHWFASYNPAHYIPQAELRLKGLREGKIGPYRDLPEHLPALPLGTKIDFIRPLPPYLFLRDGWGEPGEQFRWTNETAALRFWIDTVEPLRLRLRAAILQPRRINIELNGKEIQSLNLNGESDDIFEIELPSGVIQHDNTLTFSVRSVAAPADGVSGKDGRPTGLGVAWMEFVKK